MALRPPWWAPFAARKPLVALGGFGALAVLAATVGVPGGGSAGTPPATDVAAFVAFSAETVTEPVAPVDLTITSVSPTAVSLRWRASTDALPGGWVLDHRVSGGSTWTSTEIDGATTVATLDGLAEGTDYDLRVVAVEEDHRSAPALVTARTTVTDPIPIVERTSTEGTGSTSTDGDSASAGATGGAGTTSTDTSGPSGGPSGGEAGGAAGAPGAPTALVAVPGDGTVTLTWTAPADTGGSAIDGWLLELTDGSGWQPAVDADGDAANGTATVTGLVNGTTYGFRVAARNDTGTGAFGDPAAATPAPARLLATAGGATTDDAHGIAALPDGSALVTGSFGGTATFGATTAVSAGGADVYVARLSAIGTWAWVTTVGTAGSDVGRAITGLPDGSAVVTGQLAGAATFGTTTVTAFGGADVFVARISRDGTWQWATTAGGTGADDGRGIAALPDGSTVVVGSVAANASFGTTTLAGAGGADLFAARVDATGTWTWARSGGGTGGDHAAAVAPLPDGSVVLTGSFEGTASFGGTAFSAIGGDDLVAARLSSSGTWTWVTRAGGSGPDSGRAVTVRADGSAVVAGTLGGTAVVAGTILTPIGGADLLVAALSTEGQWTWALAGGSAADDHARGIVARPDGSVFLSGQLGAAATIGTAAVPSAGGADLVIGAVTAEGAWAWAVSAGGADTDLARAITLLPDGAPAVAGELVGPALVGSANLPGLGAADTIVVKPTPAGLLP
jgi:hypothetical protein